MESRSERLDRLEKFFLDRSGDDILVQLYHHANQIGWCPETFSPDQPLPASLSLDEMHIISYLNTATNPPSQIEAFFHRDENNLTRILHDIVDLMLTRGEQDFDTRSLFDGKVDTIFAILSRLLDGSLLSQYYAQRNVELMTFILHWIHQQLMMVGTFNEQIKLFLSFYPVFTKYLRFIALMLNITTQPIPDMQNTTTSLSFHQQNDISRIRVFQQSHQSQYLKALSDMRFFINMPDLILGHIHWATISHHQVHIEAIEAFVALQHAILRATIPVCLLINNKHPLNTEYVQTAFQCNLDHFTYGADLPFSYHYHHPHDPQAASNNLDNDFFKGFSQQALLHVIPPPSGTNSKNIISPLNMKLYCALTLQVLLCRTLERLHEHLSRGVIASTSLAYNISGMMQLLVKTFLSTRSDVMFNNYDPKQSLLSQISGKKIINPLLMSLMPPRNRQCDLAKQDGNNWQVGSSHNHNTFFANHISDFLEHGFMLLRRHDVYALSGYTSNHLIDNDIVEMTPLGTIHNTPHAYYNPILFDKDFNADQQMVDVHTAFGVKINPNLSWNYKMPSLIDDVNNIDPLAVCHNTPNARYNRYCVSQETREVKLITPNTHIFIDHTQHHGIPREDLLTAMLDDYLPETTRPSLEEQIKYNYDRQKVFNNTDVQTLYLPETMRVFNFHALEFSRNLINVSKNYDTLNMLKNPSYTPTDEFESSKDQKTININLSIHLHLLSQLRVLLHLLACIPMDYARVFGNYKPYIPSTIITNIMSCFWHFIPEVANLYHPAIYPNTLEFANILHRSDGRGELCLNLKTKYPSLLDLPTCNAPTLPNVSVNPEETEWKTPDIQKELEAAQIKQLTNNTLNDTRIYTTTGQYLIYSGAPPPKSLVKQWPRINDQYQQEYSVFIPPIHEILVEDFCLAITPFLHDCIGLSSRTNFDYATRIQLLLQYNFHTHFYVIHQRVESQRLSHFPNQNDLNRINSNRHGRMGLTLFCYMLLLTSPPEHMLDVLKTASIFNCTYTLHQHSENLIRDMTTSYLKARQSNDAIEKATCSTKPLGQNLQSILTHPHDMYIFHHYNPDADVQGILSFRKHLVTTHSIEPELASLLFPPSFATNTKTPILMYAPLSYNTETGTYDSSDIRFGLENDPYHTAAGVLLFFPQQDPYLPNIAYYNRYQPDFDKNCEDNLVRDTEMIKSLISLAKNNINFHGSCLPPVDFQLLDEFLRALPQLSVPKRGLFIDDASPSNLEMDNLDPIGGSDQPINTTNLSETTPSDTPPTVVGVSPLGPTVTNSTPQEPPPQYHLIKVHKQFHTLPEQAHPDYIPLHACDRSQFTDTNIVSYLARALVLTFFFFTADNKSIYSDDAIRKLNAVIPSTSLLEKQNPQNNISKPKTLAPCNTLNYNLPIINSIHRMINSTELKISLYLDELFLIDAGNTQFRQSYGLLTIQNMVPLEIVEKILNKYPLKNHASEDDDTPDAQYQEAHGIHKYYNKKFKIDFYNRQAEDRFEHMHRDVSYDCRLYYPPRYTQFSKCLRLPHIQGDLSFSNIQSILSNPQHPLNHDPIPESFHHNTSRFSNMHMLRLMVASTIPGNLQLPIIHGAPLHTLGGKDTTRMTAYGESDENGNHPTTFTIFRPLNAEDEIEEQHRTSRYQIHGHTVANSTMAYNQSTNLWLRVGDTSQNYFDHARPYDTRPLTDGTIPPFFGEIGANPSPELTASLVLEQNVRKYPKNFFSQSLSSSLHANNIPANIIRGYISRVEDFEREVRNLEFEPCPMGGDPWLKHVYSSFAIHTYMTYRALIEPISHLANLPILYEGQNGINGHLHRFLPIFEQLQYMLLSYIENHRNSGSTEIFANNGYSILPVVKLFGEIPSKITMYLPLQPEHTLQKLLQFTISSALKVFTNINKIYDTGSLLYDDNYDLSIDNSTLRNRFAILNQTLQDLSADAAYHIETLRDDLNDQKTRITPHERAEKERDLILYTTRIDTYGQVPYWLQIVRNTYNTPVEYVLNMMCAVIAAHYSATPSDKQSC